MEKFNIEQYIQNPLYQKLSKEYVQYQAIEELDIDDKKVKATIKLLGNTHICEFLYKGNKIENAKCDCGQCNENDLCFHIGAALYHCNNTDITSLPYHFKQTKEDLIQQMKLNRKREVRRQNLSRYASNTKNLIDQNKMSYQKNIMTISQTEKAALIARLFQQSVHLARTFLRCA